MFSHPLFVTILLIVGFTTISAYHSLRCRDGQFTNHETSCIKYKACENRRYVERTCNFGVWNQKSSKCDFITSICRVKTDDSWHPSLVPDCTNPKNKHHQFAHPFDCSKYYKCFKNKLVESECPKGLFWNHYNWSCDQRTTCEAGDPRINSNRITIEPEEESTPTRRYNNKGSGCGKDNKDDDLIDFDEDDDDDDNDYSSDESIGY